MIWSAAGALEMHRIDHRVERTALLIGDSEVMALQAERALRSAKSENRRVFRRPQELESCSG